MLWYWKIDEIVDLLESIDVRLHKLLHEESPEEEEKRD